MGGAAGDAREERTRRGAGEGDLTAVEERTSTACSPAGERTRALDGAQQGPSEAEGRSARGLRLRLRDDPEALGPGRALGAVAFSHHPEAARQPPAEGRSAARAAARARRRLRRLDHPHAPRRQRSAAAAQGCAPRAARVGRRHPPPHACARGGPMRAEQLGSLEDPAEHDPHLERRERRAQAAPGPAAERQPCRRRGRVASGSARGGTRPGPGSARRAGVDRLDRRRHLDPGGDHVVADASGRSRTRRPRPVTTGRSRRVSLIDRVEVFEIARPQSSDAGARAPVDRPGSARTPSPAQLAVVSWPATSSVISSSCSSSSVIARAGVVATRGDQRREDVHAPLEVRRRAPACDRPPETLADRAAVALEARSRRRLEHPAHPALEVEVRAAVPDPEDRAA